MSFLFGLSCKQAGQVRFGPTRDRAICVVNPAFKAFIQVLPVKLDQLQVKKVGLPPLSK